MVSPYGLDSTNELDRSFKNYNLVPLQTIKIFITGNTWTSTLARLSNLTGNISLFVPLGFFLPLVFIKMNTFLKVFLATLLVSLFFELFQLFTHTGFCDIDDLMLNTFGGAVGYAFFVFIYR